MDAQNVPPTPVSLSPDQVELLKKYRDLVMPAARLANYDDFAKWLFTIAAMIGTLGAAFSNAALKSLGGTGASVFFFGIVATGISLALAVIQRTIDITEPNWQSLPDMIAKTEALLRVKRKMAWAAGVFFALAILLAGLAPLVSTSPKQTPVQNSITYSLGKDGVRTAITLVKKETSESELTILAKSSSGTSLLASQRSTPDQTGVVKLDIASGAVPTGTTGIVFTLQCNMNDSRTQNFTLTLQNGSVAADQATKAKPVGTCE
jgi:hypothetical protein